MKFTRFLSYPQQVLPHNFLLLFISDVMNSNLTADAGRPNTLLQVVLFEDDTIYLYSNLSFQLRMRPPLPGVRLVNPTGDRQAIITLELYRPSLALVWRWNYGVNKVRLRLRSFNLYKYVFSFLPFHHTPPSCSPAFGFPGLPLTRCHLLYLTVYDSYPSHHRDSTVMNLCRRSRRSEGYVKLLKGRPKVVNYIHKLMCEVYTGLFP